jgi:hypothetical protein
MRTLTFRGILSWLLIMLMASPCFAANSAAAMLYTNGTAWINGGTIPKSYAIFAGDLVKRSPIPLPTSSPAEPACWCSPIRSSSIKAAQ